MKTNHPTIAWLALLALSTLNPQLREASRRSVAKADQPVTRSNIMKTFMAMLIALLTLTYTAFAQGTAFTYQGRLNDGASPANGIYDLRFAIYDAASGGSVVGAPLTNSAAVVSNGLFTVTLDFGADVFDGSARWLDIAVRTNGTGAFNALAPRQAVAATPYAVQAANAANATSATTATTAASVPASGIGSGTANINITGYAVSAVSAANAGSAAVAATAGSFTGPLAGDVTGTQGATMVERIRGVQVSTNTPSAAQHLRFDGTRWVPAAVALDTDVSGTLADTRLTTNVALLNANQMFTGSNTFAGVAIVTNEANAFNGSFTGNGAGLTDLPAERLVGTIADARLSSQVMVLDSNQMFTGAVQFNNISNNFTGVFTGNGAGVTNVLLSTLNSEGAVVVNNVFLLSSSPAVGDWPYSVCAADFNGDGRPDLACANYGINTLSVLTNDGSGGFGLSSSPEVGNGPQSVATADFNKDGWMDLASADQSGGYGNGSLTVLTNNGNGGFAFCASPPVGMGPNSVSIADFNQDGWPDLACANFWDWSLSVLTNNRSGDFSPTATLSVATEPFAVTAADVNGDGRADLITANDMSSTLSVWTNNGSGGFGLSSSPVVGNGPQSVAAADVNGDGWTDLISANSWENTLSVLTNNRSGGFATASSPPVGSNPWSVIPADMNGDGWADLISANYYGNTLTVLTNNRNGGFETFASPGVGANPISVAATDVNGDGRMDLVSANNSGNSLSVVLQIRQGYFTGRFFGDGTGLIVATTNLAGTVPDARLSANVALLNTNATFAGTVSANTLNGALDAGYLTGPLTASFDPVVIGGINNGGDAWGVAVAGNYAYLANYTDGLRVYDVSNPRTPVNVAFDASAQHAQDVAVSGHYAFVAEEFDGLHIYDISNPASPVHICQTNNGGAAVGVMVVGNYAYLANWTDGLRIYDVSNPTNPVSVGHINNGGRAGQVAVAGNYAYLANQEDGLRIYNISNPASPVSVGHINNGAYAYDVAVSGDFAYLANWNDGLRVYNISDPTNPVNIGHIYNGGSGRGVGVAGTYAYLCNGDGLRVYDISNPTNVVCVGHAPSAYGAIRMAIAGTYGYVGCRDGGLQIFGLGGTANADHFQGSGAWLTDLDAGQLSSGTVSDSRLSTNVALLNANQTFSGSNTFSGVVTLTNAANVIAGDGSGLTNLAANAIVGGLTTNIAVLVAGGTTNTLCFTNGVLRAIQ